MPTSPTPLTGIEQARALAKTYRGADDYRARTTEYDLRYWATEEAARASARAGERLATREAPGLGWIYRGIYGPDAQWIPSPAEVF